MRNASRWKGEAHSGGNRYNRYRILFIRMEVAIVNKEITFTNWVRIGDRRVALNDLPKDQQQRIADSLIYRPLTTIADVSVVKTA